MNSMVELMLWKNILTSFNATTPMILPMAVT